MQQQRQERLDRKEIAHHWMLRNRPDRDVAFELRHDFEDLGINCPVVQVGNGTFEERSHARVSGLDIPVVACVVCVWPCDTNLADEMANRVFLRVLVEQLPYLGPR